MISEQNIMRKTQQPSRVSPTLGLRPHIPSPLYHCENSPVMYKNKTHKINKITDHVSGWHVEKNKHSNQISQSEK